MASKVLLQKDIANLAVAKSGVKTFTIGKFLVNVSAEMDSSVLKLLEKDPLFYQKVTDAANKDLDKIVNGLADELKYLDQQYEKFPSHATQIKADAEKRVKKIGEDTQKLMEQVVKEEWAKFQKLKADYMKYKIKTGVKISVEGIKLIVSTALLASAATPGAAAIVLGIYGIVKSVAKLAQDIHDLAKDAEAIQKEVGPLLIKVAKFYQEKGKQKTGGIELAAAAWEEITSHQAPSITKCEKRNSLYKSKLDGLELKAHSTAQSLNQVLEKQTKCDELLDKHFDALEKLLKTDPAIQEINKLYNDVKKDLEQLQTEATNLILACQSLVKRVGEGRVTHKDYAGQVAKLKEKVPKWSEVLQQAVPIISLATSTSWADPKIAAKLVFCGASIVQKTQTYDKALAKLSAKLA